MFKIQATGLAGPKFRTGGLLWVWADSTGHARVMAVIIFQYWLPGLVRCWQMVASDRACWRSQIGVMVDMVRSGLWMQFCISPANPSLRLVIVRHGKGWALKGVEVILLSTGYGSVLFSSAVCTVVMLNRKVCGILEQAFDIESSKDIGLLLRRL